MNMISSNSPKRGIPVLTVAIAAVCVAIALLCSAFPDIWYLLANRSSPEYFWQYASGVFVHGSPLDGTLAVWSIWAHLGVNMLMFIPMASVAEKTLGKARLLVVLASAWLVSSVLFLALTRGQDVLSCGISDVAFSAVPIGFSHVFHIWKKDKKAFFKTPAGFGYLLVFLVVAATLVTFTGVSFVLHFSGLMVGLLFLLLFKKTKRG